MGQAQDMFRREGEESNNAYCCETLAFTSHSLTSVISDKRHPSLQASLSTIRRTKPVYIEIKHRATW